MLVHCHLSHLRFGLLETSHRRPHDCQCCHRFQILRQGFVLSSQHGVLAGCLRGDCGGHCRYPLAQETRALYPTVTVLVPPDGVVPLCGASTALTDASCVWPGVPYVGAGANSFTVHAANASTFLVQNFRVENITTSRYLHSAHTLLSEVLLTVYYLAVCR